MCSVLSPKDWYRDLRNCKKKHEWIPPNYSIIKISKNTEKSPGDFRTLAVTQTPVVRLAWKTHRGVTINYIISECSKLAKEYKTRHDWVGKVIHWEMCKKFKFDPMNKWYMHNPVSVQENDTHKLWNTDGSPNLDQKTRSNYNQQKKKRTCKIVNFAVSADHRMKLEG